MRNFRFTVAVACAFACAFAVAVMFAVAGCDLFTNQGSLIKTSGASNAESSPAQRGDGPFQYDTGGTVNGEVDDDGNLLVHFVDPRKADGGGRSVAGVTTADDGLNFRNVYQLIAVSAEANNEVWAFDEGFPDAETELSVAVERNTRYHLLLLAGHVNDLAAYKAAAAGTEREKPALLASGFATLTTGDGEKNIITFTMTPMVVDTRFMSPEGETRQAGRLAKAVGLDAEETWSFRVTLGSAMRGAVFPDDALGIATGDGLAPLTSAENATSRGLQNLPGLDLVSNAAYFGAQGASDLTPIHDSNESNHNRPSTTGVADYVFQTGDETAEANLAAYFTMEYAPFGFADSAAWEENTLLAAAPVWVIRNGLNDTAEDAAGGFDPESGNGAIAVGITPEGGLAAQNKAGIYEGNNPWPVRNLLGGSYDLNTALQIVQDAGLAAQYGTYTLKLNTPQTVPAHIQLGSDTAHVDGDNIYSVQNTHMVIENLSDNTWIWPAVSELFTLTNGNTVRYGTGFATPDLLIYDTNGGGEAPAAQPIYGTAITVDDGQTLSKTIYDGDGGTIDLKFLGWTTVADDRDGRTDGIYPMSLTGSFTTDNWYKANAKDTARQSINPPSGITLYAVWGLNVASEADFAAIGTQMKSTYGPTGPCVSDGYYVQTADITLTATNETTFYGIYEGNGRTITTTATPFLTLCGTARNFVVKGAISGVNCGGVVSNLDGGTVRNVAVHAAITSTADSTYYAAGGIAAMAFSSEGDITILIANCAVISDVSSTAPASLNAAAGGIVGMTSGGSTTLRNCYVGGDVSASFGGLSNGYTPTIAVAGGILGYNMAGSLTITNCVALGAAVSYTEAQAADSNSTRGVHRILAYEHTGNPPTLNANFARTTMTLNSLSAASSDAASLDGMDTPIATMLAPSAATFWRSSSGANWAPILWTTGEGNTQQPWVMQAGTNSGGDGAAIPRLWFDDAAAITAWLASL